MSYHDGMLGNRLAEADCPPRLKQLGFRTSPDVAARIAEAAAAERRSVSNWLALTIERVLNARDAAA